MHPRGHRSCPPPRRIGAILLAFLGGWLLFGTFALGYPYTVIGQDSQLREAGFSIVVSLAAMSLLMTRSRIGTVVALSAEPGW